MAKSDLPTASATGTIPLAGEIGKPDLDKPKATKGEALDWIDQAVEELATRVGVTASSVGNGEAIRRSWRTYKTQLGK
jgi:hypothetical protein